MTRRSNIYLNHESLDFVGMRLICGGIPVRTTDSEDRLTKQSRGKYNNINCYRNPIYLLRRQPLNSHWDESYVRSCVSSKRWSMPLLRFRCWCCRRHCVSFAGFTRPTVCSASSNSTTAAAACPPVWMMAATAIQSKREQSWTRRRTKEMHLPKSS